MSDFVKKRFVQEQGQKIDISGREVAPRVNKSLGRCHARKLRPDPRQRSPETGFSWLRCLLLLGRPVVGQGNVLEAFLVVAAIRERGQKKESHFGKHHRQNTNSNLLVSVNDCSLCRMVVVIPWVSHFAGTKQIFGGCRKRPGIKNDLAATTGSRESIRGEAKALANKKHCENNRKIILEIHHGNCVDGRKVCNCVVWWVV